MKQNIWEGLTIQNLSKQFFTIAIVLTAAIAFFQALAISTQASDVFSFETKEIIEFGTLNPSGNFVAMVDPCHWEMSSGDFAVGGVKSLYFTCQGGPPNTTIYFTVYCPYNSSNVAVNNVIGVSSNLGGPFTAMSTSGLFFATFSLSLNSLGNGQSAYVYLKGLAPASSLRLYLANSNPGTAANFYFNVTSTPPPPTPSPTPTPKVDLTVQGTVQPQYISVGSYEKAYAVVTNGVPNYTGNITVSTGTTNPTVKLFKLGYPNDLQPELTLPIQLDSTGTGEVSFYMKGFKASANYQRITAGYYGSTTPYYDHYDITPVNVQSVWLERDAGQISLDTNPQVGGGLRIFPEKKTPTDTSFGRDKVIVKAKIFPAVQGVRVNFKIFDVDDPTVIDPVIDPTGDGYLDPNGILGNDNRDTTNFYSLNPASVITNANGEAFNYVQVSQQPGDNIRVGASCNANAPYEHNEYLDDALISGINVTDSVGNILGASGSVTSSGVVTPLLTTWRRLHIERDSMGVVAGNFETRTALGAAPLNRGTRIDLTGGASLNDDRFVGGRVVLVFSSSSSTVVYKIIGNGANFVFIAESIPTDWHGHTATATLYDDDDVNGNDGTTKDGDNGEDVPMPSIDWMADNDNPGFNGFFPAYIRPTFDLTGSENSLAFAANIPKADNTSEFPTVAEMGSVQKFDNAASREDREFWTVYLFGAYQSAVDVDLDPDNDYLRNGFPNGYLGFANEFYGAICFMEHMIDDADHNYPVDPNDPRYNIFILPQDTPLHEVSHLLGSDHGDGGRIDQLTPRWSGKTLDHMRSVTFPQFR